MRHALILALLFSGTAFAGELRLGWTATPGTAITYNVYIGTVTGVYGPAIPALTNSFTGTIADGGPYFVCVRAVDTVSNLESVGCSNEVSTWARATVVTAESIRTGPLAYTMVVAGTNFSPGALATIIYPGLTQGLMRRISATTLEVDFTLAADTAGGTADVTVQNLWTDSAGVGGLIGPTAVGALTIVPSVPPADVAGVAVL